MKNCVWFIVVVSIISYIPASFGEKNNASVFVSPLKYIDKESRLIWQRQDPITFYNLALPKLELPVERPYLTGMFNYMAHGENSACHPPYYGGDQNVNSNPNNSSDIDFEHQINGIKTYDNDCKKRSYENHRGTDFLVSPEYYSVNERFSYNYIINPFPTGAVVEVTGIKNTVEEGDHSSGNGNTLTITAYIDGDPDNKER